MSKQEAVAMACGIAKRDGTVCTRNATVQTREKGLICCRHYAGYRSRGTVEAVECRCIISGCKGIAIRRGLCGKHRMQIYEHGEVRDRTIRDPNGIVIKDNIAEMALYDKNSTQVAATLFDSDMIEEVQQYKWSLGYLHGYVRNGLHSMPLHRLIMGTAPEGKEIDHINRNKLDNRRQNLRFVTRTQNLMNTGIQQNNTSGTKGVYLDKSSGKWRARIGMDGKRICLGCFNKKEDAIAARKVAEARYFGEYAPVHVP